MLPRRFWASVSSILRNFTTVSEVDASKRRRWERSDGEAGNLATLSCLVCDVAVTRWWDIKTQDIFVSPALFANIACFHARGIACTVTPSLSTQYRDVSLSIDIIIVFYTVLSLSDFRMPRNFHKTPIISANNCFVQIVLIKKSTSRLKILMIFPRNLSKVTFDFKFHF